MFEKTDCDALAAVASSPGWTEIDHGRPVRDLHFGPLRLRRFAPICTSLHLFAVILKKRWNRNFHAKPPRGMGRSGSAYGTQGPAGAVNRAFSARLSLLAMNPGLSAWAGMSDAVGVDTVGLLCVFDGVDVEAL